MSLDDSLVVHLPLSEDAADVASQCDVTNHGVDFGVPGPGGRLASAARFAGKSSYIEMPPCDELALARGDFTVSAWVHSDVLCDAVGDIVSKFDHKKRRGLSLGVVSHAGAASAQSNYRNIHFGIDDGKADAAWHDCGRPGEAAKIFALTVFKGDLYAGTFEWDGAGHVYRYEGEGRWLDCGSPNACNSVASLAVHDGDLYCGVGLYPSEGSLLPPSPNENMGGAIYRYAGGADWVYCGHPRGDARMATNLTTYRGRLYTSFLYDDKVFEYQGGTEWAPVGLEGVKLLAMTVYRGSMYGLEQGKQGKDHHSGIYRYGGDAQWDLVTELEGTRQVYSAATYRGDLYIGTWPEASIHRCDPNGTWEMVSPTVGYGREVMAMNVYNGKLYCGVLPLASVHRYEDGGGWTFMGILDHSNVVLRRVWSMCVHDGRLYGGTLPSGHVRSFQAGAMATHDHTLPPGWHHVAAIRAGDRLRLYLDGGEVARSAILDSGDFNLTNDTPLTVGFGVHDYFEGAMCDLRIYNRSLTNDEVGDLLQLGK